MGQHRYGVAAAAGKTGAVEVIAQGTGGSGLRVPRRFVAVTVWPVLLVLLFGCAGCAAIGATPVAPAIGAALASGEPQDVLVAFDAAAIDRRAAALNKAKGLAFDDAQTLDFKKQAYAALKNRVLANLPDGSFDVLKNYPVLPMLLLRLRSQAALQALVAQPSVVGVYGQRRLKPLPAVP